MPTCWKVYARPAGAKSEQVCFTGYPYRSIDARCRPTVVPTLAPIFNRPCLGKQEEAASYPGLEIIAKLATVLEVESAELICYRRRSRSPTCHRLASV
jgi:hypothetical protein